ncbi:MAG: nucleotidyltransferase family protein [Caulobacteraceae bacterium]|nr:nucleotidyltransferase family protein [Caulobacteraceae bacterium]
MTREAVIATLRAHEAALRQKGVAHAALFGSLARGEAGPDSDIDIMVELDPAAEVDLYDYVGITRFITDIITGKVDVSNRASLKAHVRPAAERDAVHAF